MSNDVAKDIGNLLLAFENMDDFVYFDFKTETCPNLDDCDDSQSFDLVIDGDKLKVLQSVRGSDEEGFTGKCFVCIHGDADWWFTCQWTD